MQTAGMTTVSAELLRSINKGLQTWNATLRRFIIRHAVLTYFQLISEDAILLRSIVNFTLVNFTTFSRRTKRIAVWDLARCSEQTRGGTVGYQGQSDRRISMAGAVRPQDSDGRDWKAKIRPQEKQLLQVSI
jgi:hypothetical protein